MAERLCQVLEGGELTPAELHVEDLHLALSCLQGDARALRELERLHLAALQRELSRAGFSSQVCDEVRQRLSEQLLMGRDGIPGRLATYSGRSSLSAWLRVAGVREAVRCEREQRADEPLEEGVLEQRASEDDPELAVLKGRCRTAFSAAFSAALAELSGEERLLLKQHHLDGLSIDVLAQCHRIHRTTAGRRVARARARLASRTAAHLKQAMQLRSSEAQWMIGLIRSELDVSLRRLLTEPAPS